MSFTVQVGPVLAARLNSMSCSYWSSQASSRKGLSCMRAPRRRSWFLLLTLRVGARMIFSLPAMSGNWTNQDVGRHLAYRRNIERWLPFIVLVNGLERLTSDLKSYQNSVLVRAAFTPATVS